MSIKDINEWANKRLKRPNGTWDTDTSDTIFNCLCNRCPPRDDLCDWNPNNKIEYMRLVEIACGYIKWANDIHGASILHRYLRRDFREYPREQRHYFLDWVETLLK